MTILYALELDERSTPPSEMWRQRPAKDVKADWTLRLLDGRTVTAVGDAEPGWLGRVAIPYAATAHQLHGLDPDVAHFGADRLIPTRDLDEETAYQNAVNDMAAIAASREGTK